MDDVIQLKTKVEKRLKLYGLRPTKARLRIGMMLLDHPKHLSAENFVDRKNVPSKFCSVENFFDPTNFRLNNFSTEFVFQRKKCPS